MPIYSYRCENCGHQQDVLQKMSDPLLVNCPACGAASFRKQVTAAGFQLKGSGWYVTDFRNNAAKDPSKGVSKSDGEASGGEASGASADKPAASPAADAPAPAPAAAADGKAAPKVAKPSPPPTSSST